MKIQTFSIIAGSEACNARCPFCVSKMTPSCGFDELKEPEVNWRNFEKACLLAKQSGATTAMFTGKGEPTLFPDQITSYLDELQRHEFPLIEMQTNGIMLSEKPQKYDANLKDWYRLGMTTIAISIVHYDPTPNKVIYLANRSEYIDLPKLIEKLHNFGFSVRLTCIAARDYIDTSVKLLKLIQFAKLNKVEQLTITPVNKPEHPEHQEAWDWTNTHHLLPEQLDEIKEFLKTFGSEIMHLGHGAVVYDVAGQNVCLNNCLTVEPESEELRNIIFFPDGHVRTHWQYEGSILF